MAGSPISAQAPAALTGTVGIKPSYGRVSRHGVLPLAESLDHVGPMTRSVRDAAVVFEAIAGHDPNDSTSLQAPVPNMLAELGRGVEGLRIGFDRAYALDSLKDPPFLHSHWEEMLKAVKARAGMKPE